MENKEILKCPECNIENVIYKSEVYVVKKQDTYFTNSNGESLDLYKEYNLEYIGDTTVTYYCGRCELESEDINEFVVKIEIVK